MKHVLYQGMKIIQVNIDQMQVFVIIDNIPMGTNADMNAKI